MTLTIQNLALSSNPLAKHYSQFRVGERLLLTGHSHQAWPDCSFRGQQQAWLDAAEHVDDKWAKAGHQADLVKEGFARLLGDEHADIALGQNTHELVLRFLSALDLASKPKIITTDSEFHTLRRQLNRMAEVDIELVIVEQKPHTSLAERIAREVDSRTSAVMLSHVFYNSSYIFDDFTPIVQACEMQGAELLVDMYHSLNVLPIDLHKLDLANAYLVGGGYKYCQLGEGNCFLRVPPGCTLRPVNTGWYAEFSLLHEQPGKLVHYGEGAARFAGSTYDPTSHYRAAAVFEFFQQQGLTPELLRTISQHQIAVLATRFDALNLPNDISLDHSLALSDRAGFLVLHTPQAAKLSEILHSQGVYTDARGDSLRFGPAPYLTDTQLRAAMLALGDAYRAL
ncbi:aminotransferase class V-fold PLP-dependent enzyme [Simiduia curdlanivorans]|uniref:Aminotransferase class V-fold PLP-dependent enzyme n=1 Tax=Simiduia curdlanivorans TaxID=1492769 RepID=A0ABV8V790_9GAMM|nr:aminotransferase class V-fold PLP-dependent enzyme [Simiduia curdlanivorans]MDN3640782.1 aminotransferase class V-fold PLP-dependent enzyme [Simiduia curdlanivorans]